MGELASQATQHKRGERDDGLVRRSFDITARSVDLDARTVTVVASTTTVDSHGDIIEQDWKLDRYRKNPVVLWHHNVFGAWRYSDGMSAPEDLLPIGHAPEVAVEGGPLGQLTATIKLGSAEYNPLSQRVLLGFAEGHIRAVSVGFYPGEITEEKVEGGYRYRLSACELLEISVVPIPSNPDAVAKSIASEHEHIGRLLAERRARTAQENGPMAMTAEEKAALDSAQGEVAKLKAERDQAVQRAERAATDLAAEKARADQAVERANKAEAAHSKAQLDALQGKKFAPAEREDLDATVAKMGIDFVLKSLEKRTDLPVTAPQLNGGVQTRGLAQPAPAPTDNTAAAADSDFEKAVAAEMNAA